MIMRKRNRKTHSVLAAVLTVVILAFAGCGQNAEIHSTSEETSTAAAVSEEISEETSGTAQAQTAEPETAEIVMAGDVLMHDCLIRAGEKPDGSRDYSAFFANVKDTFESADLAMIDQETVLGGETLGFSGYPTFNSPQEVGDAEADAGIDVILHATNHALDKGAAGIENDLSFWKAQHPDIRVLGIHDSQEDEDENRIGYFTLNGMKIAVINATYGTNGISTPADKPYLVDYISDRVLSDIDEAEENADFTIVCPHWGTEYMLTPSEYQEDWAEQFAAHGADLCIGAHPHVIEPVEWVTDESTGHRMLCYYSLGNFINGTNETGSGVWRRLVGGMADVMLERSDDGTVEISDYSVVPLICQWNSDKTEFTTYEWEDYTEELAAENGILAQDPDFSYDNIETLISEVWPDVPKRTVLDGTTTHPSS